MNLGGGAKHLLWRGEYAERLEPVPELPLRKLLSADEVAVQRSQHQPQLGQAAQLFVRHATHACWPVRRAAGELHDLSRVGVNAAQREVHRTGIARGEARAGACREGGDCELGRHPELHENARKWLAGREHSSCHGAAGAC